MTTFAPAALRIHRRFPRYTRFDPAVPVVNVTPSIPGCFHRFFDTTPISPSGRYLAALRMPNERRRNAPGEEADIVLVDLEAGAERIVAHTRGWETQMGANLNWGADDRTLVYNDVDTSTWTPQLVRFDLRTGDSERVPGGVYHVSPDGRFAAAASMECMRRTQYGYGVLLPDDRVTVNVGAPEDDGLFITDLATGDRKLVLPLSEAARHIPELQGDDLDRWHIYGFHSKWSPDGSRLIFTVRRVLRAEAQAWDNISHHVLRFDVLTCRPDGTDVADAVPARYWEHGGHHINWFPDSRQLSMNLGGFGEGLRLCRVGADGSDLRPIFDESSGVKGSGHPSVHPSGHILADTYCMEWGGVSYPDGSIPLRWIDMATGAERHLVRIHSRVDEIVGGPMRVDAHPAWDRQWRYVAFNGVEENSRHVFIADMQPVLDG